MHINEQESFDLWRSFISVLQFFSSFPLIVALFIYAYQQFLLAAKMVLMSCHFGYSCFYDYACSKTDSDFYSGFYFGFESFRLFYSFDQDSIPHQFYSFWIQIWTSISLFLYRCYNQICLGSNSISLVLNFYGLFSLWVFQKYFMLVSLVKHFCQHTF